MKISLISFLLAVVVFSGCKQKTPRDFIVGKWRITDVSSTPMAESLKKATLEFTKDGTWAMTGTPAPDQGGAYSLSDDFKILTTTDVRGQQTLSDIMELSEEQLILLDRNTGIKITAVPR